MTIENPIKDLYKRIEKDTGFTRSYLHKVVLPEWWDDEIALNPAGFAQGCGYIARRLGLDLGELRSGGKIHLPELKNCNAKFFKNIDAPEYQILKAQLVASRIAAIAAYGAKKTYTPTRLTASEIRNSLLSTGIKWIGLEVLLDYCWGNGIPVIYAEKLPPKKMSGLALSVKDRPVIVLSKAYKYPSQQLFVLAHELGHIMCGHTNNNQIVVDIEVVIDSKKNISDEEKEATDFAKELISGNSMTDYTAKQFLTADNLASAAKKLGVSTNVNPAYIALNYAHKKAFMPVGIGALKLLEPEANALSILRAKMLENLDETILPEESIEFLRRVAAFN